MTAEVYDQALARLDELGLDYNALPLFRAMLIERRDREHVMVHFEGDPVEILLEEFAATAEMLAKAQETK